jgi:hypothetical protein
VVSTEWCGAGGLKSVGQKNFSERAVRNFQDGEEVIASLGHFSDVDSGHRVKSYGLRKVRACRELGGGIREVVLSD